MTGAETPPEEAELSAEPLSLLDQLDIEDAVLTASSLLPDAHSDLRSRIQTNLQLFFQKVKDPGVQHAFFAGLAALSETDEGLNTEASIVGYNLKVEEVLKGLLGNQWASENVRTYAQAVQYMRGGNVVAISVVSPDNFYFSPPSEVLAEDSFPANGKIVYSSPEARRIGKNVSIFDPNGVKVYWGDLSQDDISGLKGTYYVLDEQSSYFEVPDFAVVIDAQQIAVDPNRPAGALTEYMPTEKPMLETDYVKTSAMFAIVNGKIVANNQPHSECSS